MCRESLRTVPSTLRSPRLPVAKLICALAAALPLVLVGQVDSAEAQEGRKSGNLGVGVVAMLGGADVGTVGPAVVYDTGIFHIEGLFGFNDNDTQTRFTVGGRFWYHIHSGQSSDFSLGGGLGVVSVDPEGGGDSTTNVEIDAGAQLRAFIVPNVAVSASLGLGLLTGDTDVIAITGDLVGGLGIVYYF
jgi:hypothetical protein